MNIVIFSMNRACQLDNLLASLEENYLDLISSKITVIYRQTSKRMKIGYDKCSKQHPLINFIEQGIFKKDVISAIDITQKYTMFLVDDILFLRKFSLLDSSYEEFEFTSLNNQEIVCHSLRLYPEINECYTLGQKNTFVKNPFYFGNLMIWDWKNQPADWGYPMSVDGHIFKTGFIKKMCEKLDYINPNTFEAAMAGLASIGYVSGTKMSCSRITSKLLNIPANMVQTVFDNKHGTTDSVEILNDRYLSGERLSYSHLSNFKNKSVHVEMPLEWKK